jgi:hypothetical protein
MKAQTSQVFVYALTAIAVGLVLLLGYKFISGTLQQGCDVQMVKFREGLDREINGISHGSYHKVDLTQPCEYNKICFVDERSLGESGFDADIHSIAITQSVKAGVQTTVFLVKGDTAEPLLESMRICTPAVDCSDSNNKPANPTCFDSLAGRFTFGIEGKGQKVYVSQIPVSPGP